MKYTYFLLPIILLAFFYGPLSASRGTCAPQATCADGVCGPTESSHEHQEVRDHEKESEKESPATLNTSGLKTLLDSGAPVILLDARSDKFDDGTRIPGAKSLTDKSSIEEVKKVINDKEALIVTYCSNLQCPASYKLYKHLKSLGYPNVIKYPEGIKGWKEAGLPIKTIK
ncbi:MAG: rhodanese-like domain-containing protein [Candidatus Rifleibacteriota bacterium]